MLAQPPKSYSRCCRQNWENHGNLGQEPGTKKQFEYLLFEKMRLPNFRTGLEAEAGRQRRAWQFFSFWTSAAWISNGLPVFQFYLQISGFCWAKTCFQWQHVLFFSSLAPGGLNFHRFSNFCSKIHRFRRYKTAIFPSTLGTLDFLFFEHSFQIQRFEGRVLKSFFSRPLTP